MLAFANLAVKIGTWHPTMLKGRLDRVYPNLYNLRMKVSTRPKHSMPDSPTCATNRPCAGGRSAGSHQSRLGWSV